MNLDEDKAKVCYVHRFYRWLQELHLSGSWAEIKYLSSIQWECGLLNHCSTEWKFCSLGREQKLRIPRAEINQVRKWVKLQKLSVLSSLKGAVQKHSFGSRYLGRLGPLPQPHSGCVNLEQLLRPPKSIKNENNNTLLVMWLHLNLRKNIGIYSGDRFLTQ